MMYDVTERVEAQQAARASEERYRTVAENASDVVCRYRADGTIDWVFGSTEALTGRTADDLVGVLGRKPVRGRGPRGPGGDRRAAGARRGRSATGPAAARRREHPLGRHEGQGHPRRRRVGGVHHQHLARRPGRGRVPRRARRLGAAGARARRRLRGGAQRGDRREHGQDRLPLPDEPRAADPAQRGARLRPAPRARPPHRRAGRGGATTSAAVAGTCST